MPRGPGRWRSMRLSTATPGLPPPTRHSHRNLIGPTPTSAGTPVALRAQIAPQRNPIPSSPPCKGPSVALRMSGSPACPVYLSRPFLLTVVPPPCHPALTPPPNSRTQSPLSPGRNVPRRARPPDSRTPSTTPPLAPHPPPLPVCLFGENRQLISLLTPCPILRSSSFFFEKKNTIRVLFVHLRFRE